MRRILRLCAVLAAFHVLLLSAALSDGNEKDAAIIDGPLPMVLTDENFDAETQVATGMTSGLWFVEFFAPWCGHCKQLAPQWDLLSQRSAGKVTVATVDCTTQTALCRRFEIRSFPTLILFANGKMHRYQGSRRSVQELEDFVERGWQHLSGGEPIPPPMSWADEIRFYITLFVDDALRLKRDQPSVFYITIGVSLGLLLVTVYLFWAAASAPAAAPTAAPREISPPKAKSQ